MNATEFDMNPDELYDLAIAGVRAAMILAGEDPDREGVEETPARWVKALCEMCEGYAQVPEDTLNTMFNVDTDELVVVRDLPFSSLCEHHLLPFTGVAHIAYLPGEMIVGLSKLPRLLHVLARRPQVQERLTSEIAGTMHSVLGARGVGVAVHAHHTCMSCRGVRSTGTMITHSLLGLMRDEPALRQECLSLIS